MCINCKTVIFLIDRHESTKEACTELEFNAVSVGFSTTQITLDTLKDEVLIGVYKPLISSHKEVVLAIDTSLIVTFEGGPRPWPKKMSNHFTKGEFHFLSLYLANCLCLFLV